MKAKKNHHPKWALQHKRSGTELKLINGKYYLYAVKSEYSKELKRSKKISLGIMGSITEKQGFIPSDKAELRKSVVNRPAIETVYAYEYGFSYWLYQNMVEDGALAKIKLLFPNLWQYIVALVYTRIVYQSPLKNIPFHLSNAHILHSLNCSNFSDKAISENLRLLGQERKKMQQYMQGHHPQNTCVLMDATHIVCHSQNIDLAQQGYNSNMDFEKQFTLLYIYEAKSLQPLFYRLLPGNIREVSTLKNALLESGIQQCIFIADKGFYSENNQKELERNNIPYLLPLRRNNKKVNYDFLTNIELSNNYFGFKKRFIFFKEIISKDYRFNLYLDGQLKEQEKNDYLSRIESLPDDYNREGYLEKVNTMGTIAILHNTDFSPRQVYEEYKERGEIEQLFDHLKNTLDAKVSYMQNEDALQGWMFINHIAMQTIYKLYQKLKTTPLNKTQKLNKKYSIQDTIYHLSKIQKVMVNRDKHYITELNPNTKILLAKLQISIT